MSEEKVLEKVFGAAVIVKYVGFAVFGLSLVAIVIASLLRVNIPHITTVLILGILLIILGYVAESSLGKVIS